MAKNKRSSGTTPHPGPPARGGSKAEGYGSEVATLSKDIDIFSGYLGRLENPDPTLRSEAGGRGLKLYDEVDRDAHAGSVLQTRYLAVTGREWTVEPGDDSPQAADIATFVTESLQATNFDQARQEILQAILYGFYAAEIIWTVRNGRVVPGRILAKHPRRFCFDHERQLRLLTPANQTDGEPLPERKFICFTFGSSDNPYGKGLGSRLWWPVWFKKHGVKFWLIFLDKFGMPTAVGKYGPTASPEEKTTLLQAASSIQSEIGVTIPESMQLELLEATRGGTVTHESLCKYMDSQISKAVLGQTATTEGTPGKLGNDDTQDEVRGDIIKADADLLCECLNGTLVRWMVDLNFGLQEVYPKLWIRTEDEGDLKPLAERDKILVQDIGLPVTTQYFYDTFGIPAPADGEALVVPAPSSPAAPPQGKVGLSPVPARRGVRNAAPAFAEPDPATNRLENGIEALASDANDPAGALIDRASDLLDRAETLAEFRDQLLGLWDGKDTEALGLVMARAAWLANLSGRLDAKNNND